MVYKGVKKELRNGIESGLDLELNSSIDSGLHPYLYRKLLSKLWGGINLELYGQLRREVKKSGISV